MNNAEKAASIRSYLSVLVNGIQNGTKIDMFLKFDLHNAIIAALGDTKAEARILAIKKDNLLFLREFTLVRCSAIEALAKEIEESEDPELEFLLASEKLFADLGL